jgi:uncharacterized protein YuzE
MQHVGWAERPYREAQQTQTTKPVVEVWVCWASQKTAQPNLHRARNRGRVGRSHSSCHGLSDKQYRQVLEGRMKINYDPEVDVLHIVFSNALVDESDETRPGVILDYDKEGNVVGMEILDASKRTDNPNSVEFAVAA